MSEERDQSVLEYLRTQDNPFADLVRPQRPDDRFEELHVPEVLREPRELLFSIVDAYRLDDYTSYSDLYPTRAIRILGPRGAGKTHLLEALTHRDDTALILRRETEDYDGSVSFEEYMHQHLVRGLLARDVHHGYKPFDAIAAQLTRKILLHTLRELSPTDRLLATVPERWHLAKLLWLGDGESITKRFDELASDLEKPECGASLPRIAHRHQFHPQQLAELASARIDRYERGHDTLSIIRREFYRALVRTALLEQSDAMTDFLEADYRPKEARAISRSDVVRQLLKVMAEACALVRLPVVYAFDNLEGLLAPLGKVDADRARAFFDGLAQAIDNTRGFLFLIFAEDNFYFRELSKLVNRFADSRMQIGVRPQKRGVIHTIDLKPPSKQELCALVSVRMNRVLGQEWSNRLSSIFPFKDGFLNQLGETETAPIRTKLEALRNEYDGIVFGRAPESSPSTDETEQAVSDEQEARSLCERLWTDKVNEAGRALEAALSSNSADLVRGFGLLLQAALPLPNELAAIQKVTPSVKIGDDHRYGFATILECHEAADDGKPVRVGVAFLLARGRGMAIDLKAKFDVFTDENANADRLVILWSTDKTGENLSTQFSGNTANAWNSAEQKDRSVVRSVSMADLRKIRAFPNWLAEVRQSDETISTDFIHKFVQEKCGSVFRLVVPPTQPHIKP